MHRLVCLYRQELVEDRKKDRIFQDLELIIQMSKLYWRDLQQLKQGEKSALRKYSHKPQSLQSSTNNNIAHYKALNFHFAVIKNQAIKDKCLLALALITFQALFPIYQYTQNDLSIVFKHHFLLAIFLMTPQLPKKVRSPSIII